jgi:poly(hydroxyalkanoate) depolymerase family esterase
MSLLHALTWRLSMRTLSDTIARLAKLRGTIPAAQPSASRLSDLGPFGTNPGALAAKVFVPERLKPGAALVVVLHGCTQTAASYDLGSGWSQLAEEHGVALLFPEQSRSNNANLCFNWFVPEDTRRDSGEAMSIRQMIEVACSNHQIDRRQVFITGLSAGGAMANVMLATYPEVFAGGAIIAGLPYGVASTVPEAFDRMRGHGMPTPVELRAALRSASAHAGPWPMISIWQGTADNTVVPANADALVDQWRGVHQVGSFPTSTNLNSGHTSETWEDVNGVKLIEHFRLARMGHGTPLDGGDGCGRTGPYMLDVGISSTRQIAQSWGITPSFASEDRKSQGADVMVPRQTRAEADVSPSPVSGIQKTIEDALRSAGLMG